MKAKIRKTGEIVDVICYGGSPNRRSDVLDYVSYIDSQGVEHVGDNHLNYYWDFEPIETTANEHWQDVRECAAIAALNGLLSCSYSKGTFADYAKDAINCANALIEELKKK